MSKFCVMLRLTVRCNAKCDYCSTDTRSAKYLTIQELSKSLSSLYSYLDRIGVEPSRTGITICLLGGELSTLSIDYLREVKLLLLAFFAGCLNIEIGLQSNLIMSTKKLDEIYELFDGKIGTSIDTFSDARKFKGCANKYKKIFTQNIEHLSLLHHKIPGGCYVVCNDSLDLVSKEVKLANSNNYPLKLIISRKNALGDSFIDPSKLNSLNSLYLDLLNAWFMASSIPLDPFLYMLDRKLCLIYGSGVLPFESCSMTNQCYKQGVCIEPNGDYYFCQELADLNQLKLGNLISDSFNQSILDASEEREGSVAISCAYCEHYASCKGGCMAYSIDAGLGVSSKDPYCSLYYSIFSRLDELIDRYPLPDIIAWKESIAGIIK